MGYQFWDAIPRKADDQTRIAAFVAAELAKQDELSELNDVNIPAPGEGNVLTYEAPKWIAKAPGVGNGDLFYTRYLKVGKRHMSPMGSFSAGTVNVIADYIYATPFPIPIQMTFDRIGVYVYTTGAGLCRLGIYADDATYPGALVLDAGTVDVSSQGFKEITINQVLSAGLYWLVSLSNIPHSVESNNNTYFVCGLIGVDSLRTNNQGYWKISQAYGALPATCPGGGVSGAFLLQFTLRRSA